MLGALCRFKKQNNHCNVPARFKDNPSLGKWVARIRRAHKNGKLSDQKIKPFNKLGFKWQIKDPPLENLT